ncbi:MAG: Verru_Chthon cassette protein B [Verrucomicrobiota bacterium]
MPLSPSSNHFPPRFPHSRCPRHGFTVIETAFAVALTAVGLVAILGLLPHGLNAMKTAGDTSVQARIAQELTGEVMLTDWTLIDNYNYENTDDLRYFDNEGTEIFAEANDSRIKTPDFDFRLAFVAQILIPEADNKDAFKLPSGPADAEPDPDIKRVIVRVANVPIANLDFEDEEYRRKITTYTATVVKMLRDHDQIVAP